MKGVNSTSTPSVSIGRIGLPPAKSSLPVLISPSALSHIWSPNLWHPKTTMMESILMLWSKTSEHYSTIGKKECTTWQYTAVRGSLSNIQVITRHIYWLNNGMQWSSIFTMILQFKSRVQKLNSNPRCVDAQEAIAGAEGTDRMTRCGLSNTLGAIMACWLGVSVRNCNNYSKSSSLTRMEPLLSNGYPWRLPQYVKTHRNCILFQNVFKSEKYCRPLLWNLSACATLSAACT